jgi:Na+/H+ antiporter NhaD/arsenite permease-like protein
VTTPSASILLVTTIFGLTYLALALGKVPGLRIDRAGIALIGAAAMLGCGVISVHEAARAVDYETIVLLFGMMVVVAYLRMAGFFALATERIATRFSGPMSLLAVTIALSGVLSAFLVNDVVCVALTPLVLHLCQRLKRPPIPYLVGLATASNIGSVATITGNPQNIIIGSLSRIAYLRFAARLAPVAVAGLVLNFAVVALIYRKSLGSTASAAGQGPPPSAEARQPRVHRGLLIKSVAVTLTTIGFFFAGQPIALVALIAAGVLMLDRVRPDKVYSAIDWPLLVMFAGLFVVVHAFEVNVVRTWGLERQHALLESPVVLVSGLSLVLSNLVSNVPAVLLFKPLMEVMPQRELAWLALAMSSTLAGNLTVLGSVANLIVVENARRAGTELGFLEYLKVGVPLTVLTTLAGVTWLTLVPY